MVNKKLGEWIKAGKKRGYSKKQLENHLTKHGYKKKEIDEAVSPSQSKQKIKFNFKEFIRPSFLKLFFPILLLILIIVSFSINSVYLPPIGELSCNILKFAEDLGTKRSKNNVDSNEVINLMKQAEVLSEELGTTQITSIRILILGNIYIPTKIYKLNPFLPIPCEASIFGENYNNFRCSYYIDEEDYTCLRERERFELLKNIPSYNKINLIDLLINSLILSLEVYLIICLISFGFGIIKQKDKKLKLIISAVLILLPGALFFLSHKVDPLFWYPFAILFAVLIFIKKEFIKKIILIFFVILLISGLIIGSRYIVSGITGPGKMEYKTLYCENTKILNQIEKQSRFRSPFNKKYMDEEWNVCDNPPCHEICFEHCGTTFEERPRPQIYIELRGDKPSCICGCSIE